jgi:hypothetical protein
MRRKPAKILGLIGTALIVLLGACSNLVEKETNMITNNQIPPIDTNQPIEIETATFALG